MSKKTIIGITGGLATGKSTVAGMFAELGAVRIDADAISHEVLDSDADVAAKVAAAFGSDIVSGGRIDRRRLASKVFFDKDKLKALCDILHPPVIRRIKEASDRVAGGVVVVDAPLLMEAGLDGAVDIVVVARVDRDVQIKRAVSRGISREEAEAIIGCQMPLELKEKAADYIIDTGKDMETVKKGVESIWKRT